MRPRLRTALLAVLACLLVPGIARADFNSLYHDYAADGAINGCRYSPGELRSGLGQIPADVRQYDPGFELALETALEQRLGGCRSVPQAPASGGGTTTATDGSPGPGSPPSTRLEQIPQGPGLPAVVVGMIVLLAGVLALAAVLGLAGYFGWSVDLAPLRNGTKRLGERVSDRLYAVRDRLGF